MPQFRLDSSTGQVRHYCPGRSADPDFLPGYAAPVDLDLSVDAAELTARLVDVRSVSGEEEEFADAIFAALSPLPHLRLHRDGNAIVARTDLGAAQRVVLAGHIDTVPVAGNVPSRIQADQLYGCGTTDMKSGVAVALRLAALVPSPGRDVTYVFYDCEEVEAERNGLLRLSRNVPELLAADLAVLMEPTGGVVEGGCQGTLRAEIRVPGERAHSARAWMGRNAIHQAGAVLDLLRSYSARQPEVDGLSYHEGLNAVGISGGVAGNVIPDECVVTVNFRFAPDRSPEQAEAYVREYFEGFAVTVTDVAGGARPGLSAAAAASFAAAMGGTPRAKLGWTDVARFSALGIPAVNYGPGDPQLAHSRNEHVAVADIGDCETRIRAWLTVRP
jgi:succinyl-diaminopimelate desuccinylase